LMKSIAERAAVSKTDVIGAEDPDLTPETWDIAFLDQIEIVFSGAFYACVSL
jgi:hypothetical protein